MMKNSRRYTVSISIPAIVHVTKKLYYIKPTSVAIKSIPTAIAAPITELRYSTKCRLKV